MRAFGQQLTVALVAGIILAPAAASVAALAFWKALEIGDTSAVVMAASLIVAVVLVAMLLAYRGLKSFLLRAATSQTAASASGHERRMGAMRRALAEVKQTASLPDLRIRVSRRISPTGNTAGESYRRWLHLVVENMSPTIAHGAKLRIRIQRETTGDDRHSPIEREWMWAGNREEVDLRQGAPIEIPIAIADVEHPPTAIIERHAHLEPIGRWWITPEGHRNLTRHDVLVSARYRLQVTLMWTDAGEVEAEPPDYFILVIPEGRSGVAELIHTVSFDRY